MTLPLQNLLELTEEPDARSNISREDAFKQSRRRIVLRSGASTHIQASPEYESCKMKIPTANGEEKLVSFQKARGVFRLQARKLQDGWAELIFLPELHHGEEKSRHIAVEGGWRFDTRQEVEPLFDQKFRLKLRMDEIAVISMTPIEETKPVSPGYLFFLGSNDLAKEQRALIVRLTNMGQSAAIYSDNATPLSRKK